MIDSNRDSNAISAVPVGPPFLRFFAWPRCDWTLWRDSSCGGIHGWTCNAECDYTFGIFWVMDGFPLTRSPQKAKGTAGMTSRQRIYIVIGGGTRRC